MSKFNTGRLKKGGKIIDLRQWQANSFKQKRSRTDRGESDATPKMTLRQRRRRIRALFALLYGLIVLGLLWGANQLSYMPRFAIGHISVVGTKEVPPNLVRTFVETKLYDGIYHFLSRTNIFLYPQNSLVEIVPAGIPRIRSVQISRDALLAQAITVTVVEREPYALWCADERNCFVMDDTGFIFKKASPADSGFFIEFRDSIASSTSLSVNNPIGQTFLPDHLQQVRALLSLLSQEGYAPRSVEVVDGQDFAVLFSEGFLLRVSFEGDAQVLVRNLELALSSAPLKGKLDKVEYIDLRFGNRVYYKLEGGAQQEAE